MSRATWLAIGLGLGLGGCFRASPATGVPCAEDDHACPIGQTCDLGTLPPLCVDHVSDASAGEPAADAPPVACGSAVDGCPATAPICDSLAHACRGCEADLECPDDVCVESTGACVAAADALYVATTGAGTTCTRTEPCATITAALAAMTATRRTIAVAGGTYTEAVSVGSAGSAVVISGASVDPSATTISVNDDATFVIQISASTVTVEGLTLAAARTAGLRVDSSANVTAFALATASSNHDGIDMVSSTLSVLRSTLAGSGVGIATNGGAITIDRTLVHGTAQQGIRLLTTSFAITNSMFVDSSTIGVELDEIPASPPSMFAFNTVAANGQAGMRCDSAFAVSSSIFANGSHQDLATCTATYSLFGEAVPTGTGNLEGNPLFLTTTDFHISVVSPAVDAADPAATDPIDFDGQARPIGAGRDIGADETH